MLADEERDELRRIQDELIRLNPGLDPQTRICEGGPTLEELGRMLFPAWVRTMKDLINEA